MASTSQSNRKTLPQIVGFYSVDHYNNCCENISALKYIRNVYNRELPFELNGVVVKASNYCDMAFSNLLKFLKWNGDILATETDNIPIVCSKITLVKLCQSGYMQITACLYRNVIFLKSRNTPGGYFSSNTSNYRTSSHVPRKMRPVIPRDIPEGVDNTLHVFVASGWVNKRTLDAQASETTAPPRTWSQLFADQENTDARATPSSSVEAEQAAPATSPPSPLMAEQENPVEAEQTAPTTSPPPPLIAVQEIPVEAEQMAPPTSPPPPLIAAQENPVEAEQIAPATRMPPRTFSPEMDEEESLGPQARVAYPPSIHPPPVFGSSRATFLEQRGARANRAPRRSPRALSLAVADKELRWKLKFKQFLQSGIPLRKGDMEKPAYGNQEFNCVYKYTLKDHTVFYSAGVDGFNVNEKCHLVKRNSDNRRVAKHLNEMELVNLHITFLKKNRKELTKYRRDTSQTIWLNAFLNHASKITIGNVDSQGFLRSLSQRTANDMIELGKDFWTPEDCLQDGNIYLNFIKRTFADSMSDATDMRPTTKYFKQMGRTIIEVSRENANGFPRMEFE